MWVVVLNAVIVAAYLAIASLIFQGLVTTRQLRSNRLAVATGVIFLTCAVHHGHHALHLVVGSPEELSVVRASFGTWHGMGVEVAGALIAVVYLALRHSYGTLLSTPAMFEDQVRLATEERLRGLAFTDGLTGIGNRAAFDAVVDELDPEHHVTVVFLDLDGFKVVNDTHGHATGDRLVAQVGARLAGAMQEGERVFRFGGDEFVVLRVAEGPADEVDLAERCRAACHAPLAVREGEVACTASLGVASGAAGDGVSDLVREADMAMYVAKRASVPPPRSEPPLTRDEVSLP